MLLSQKCGTLLIPVIRDEKELLKWINLHAILIRNFSHICSSLFCSIVRFRTLNNNHLQSEGSGRPTRVSTLVRAVLKPVERLTSAALEWLLMVSLTHLTVPVVLWIWAFQKIPPVSDPTLTPEPLHWLRQLVSNDKLYKCYTLFSFFIFL